MMFLAGTGAAMAAARDRIEPSLAPAPWQVRSASAKLVRIAAAQSAHFSASPSSGVAPLTVKFCASAGIGIDFGDGTSGSMGIAQKGDCPPEAFSYTTHTYREPGQYRLRGFPCPSAHDVVCGQVARLASAITITVMAAR